MNIKRLIFGKANLTSVSSSHSESVVGNPVYDICSVYFGPEFHSGGVVKYKHVS